MTTIKELEYCHNYSTFKYIDFVNNEITIERKSDLLNIECLEFSDYFTTTNANFVIKSNEKIILNLPFKILMELNKMYELDGKVYLKINFNWFIQDLLIVCMEYSSIKILITNISNVAIKLLVKYIYIDSISREYILNNNNISTIQTINILNNNYNNTNSNTHIFNLLPNKKYKGFYIISDNINNISHIKLHCSNVDVNEDVFYYDKYLCKNICVSLSDTLLYIPISTDLKYNERLYKDVYNSIWTDSDSNYILEITFDNKVIKNILMYELCIDICCTFYGLFDHVKCIGRDSKLLSQIKMFN